MTHLNAALADLLETLRDEQDCLDRQDIEGLDQACARKLTLIQFLRDHAPENSRVDRNLAVSLRQECHALEMRLHVLIDMTQRRLGALMRLQGDTPVNTYCARGRMQMRTSASIMA
jgi:flagellar biosynthesis/type III secretory pathway chaperone